MANMSTMQDTLKAQKAMCPGDSGLPTTKLKGWSEKIKGQYGLAGCNKATTGYRV